MAFKEYLLPSILGGAIGGGIVFLILYFIGKGFFGGSEIVNPNPNPQFVSLELSIERLLNLSSSGTGLETLTDSDLIPYDGLTSHIANHRDCIVDMVRVPWGESLRITGRKEDDIQLLNPNNLPIDLNVLPEGQNFKSFIIRRTGQPTAAGNFQLEISRGGVVSPPITIHFGSNGHFNIPIAL